MVNNDRLNVWGRNLCVSWNSGATRVLQGKGSLIEFQKHILSTKAEVVLDTVVQCLHCFSWQSRLCFQLKSGTIIFKSKAGLIMLTAII